MWLPEGMWGQLWDKGFSDAGEKRQSLVGNQGDNYSPNYLSVHPGTVGGPLTQERINRGWGGVLWSFYGDFLSWLSMRMPVVHSSGTTAPRCSHIFPEVWAYPYNWTDDNKNSAKGQGESIGVGSDVGLKKIIETAIAETTEKYKDTDIKVLKPTTLAIQKPMKPTLMF